MREKTKGHLKLWFWKVPALHLGEWLDTRGRWELWDGLLSPGDKPEAVGRCPRRHGNLARGRVVSELFLKPLLQTL